MTNKLTAYEAASLSGWDVAAKLGCQYAGDCSPIPFDGMFFSTTNWKEHGYADCVRIIDVDGKTLIERGVVNRPDDDKLIAAYGSCGLDVDLETGLVVGTGYKFERTPESDIECVSGYAGIEVSEFIWATDDDEVEAWQLALPWIIDLS